MAFKKHVTREVFTTVQETQELLDRPIYIQWNNRDLVCIKPTIKDNYALYKYVYIKRIGSDYQITADTFADNSLDEMNLSKNGKNQRLAQLVLTNARDSAFHQEIPEAEFLYMLQKALCNRLDLHLTLEDQTQPSPGYQGSH